MTRKKKSAQTLYQLPNFGEIDFKIKEIKERILGDAVDHPSHYGGADNPYEAIKVIEAWGLNFNIGNVVKYLSRAGKKDDILQDLRKASWYLNREIENLEKAKK